MSPESCIAISPQAQARKLKLDTLTLASEDIASASAALRKELESSLLGDLNQVQAQAVPIASTLTLTLCRGFVLLSLRTAAWLLQQFYKLRSKSVVAATVCCGSQSIV